MWMDTCDESKSYFLQLIVEMCPTVDSSEFACDYIFKGKDQSLTLQLSDIWS
jgi:hypothetical protein